MKTIRLTMGQALVRYLAAQKIEKDGEILPLIPAAWAIFGHGNVAGLGEALYRHRDELPTFRAHNEQAMALAGGRLVNAVVGAQANEYVVAHVPFHAETHGRDFLVGINACFILHFPMNLYINYDIFWKQLFLVGVPSVGANERPVGNNPSF